MKTFIVCIFFLQMYCASAGKVQVTFEKILITFVNDTCVDQLSVESYMVNDTTNAVRSQGLLKTELNKDTASLSILLSKYVDGEYREEISLSESVYRIMTMKQVQQLGETYCNPKLVWPIKTDVLYKCDGYVPDLTPFGEFPTGKFKLTVTFNIEDQTMFTSEAYATLEESN